MPATPPRDFPDTFGLGDEVSVVRTEHGWFDGSISGTIVEIAASRCTVEITNGGSYEWMVGYREDIQKPRDIHLIKKASPNRKRKKRDRG